MLIEGMGNTEDAKVMIIGSVPNALAAIQNKPFAGPQWKALGSLMDIARLDLRNSYITMLIKNHEIKSPKTDQIDESLPELRKEWKSVGKPKILVALGRIPRDALIKTDGPIASLPMAYPIKIIKKTRVFYMYDPQTAMSRPDLYQNAERHWILFGKWLKEEGIL